MVHSLRIFSSLTGDKNLKEKINVSLKQIEAHRKELEHLRFKLEERRRVMFDAAIRAIEKNDEKRARVLAGEHVELQKVTNVVGASELALLHIVVRLETIRDVGDVMFVLSNAFKSVKSVGKSVSGVAPNLEQAASEISGSFSNVVHELGMISPNVSISLADTPNEIFEKAQKLIEERATELEDLPNSLRESSEPSLFEKSRRIQLLEGGEVDPGETEEEFHPVIFGTDDGEPRKGDPEFAVREYMRDVGTTKIDVLNASAQLNLPVDLVEQAYIKVLAEKRFSSALSSSQRQPKIE
jgi:division protein CdvB (Snf7/Vps24/ESCRT-III family)